MYKRNLKYVKGHSKEDEWQTIPDRIAEALLSHFQDYASEKGFDVNSYMEFIENNVIVKVEED